MFGALDQDCLTSSMTRVLTPLFVCAGKTRLRQAVLSHLGSRLDAHFEATRGSLSSRAQLLRDEDEDDGDAPPFVVG